MNPKVIRDEIKIQEREIKESEITIVKDMSYLKSVQREIKEEQANIACRKNTIEELKEAIEILEKKK